MSFPPVIQKCLNQKFFHSSIIVGWLKQKATDQNIGVCFVYLNYKEQHDQTPVNLIASLWKQLYIEDQILPQDIQDAFEAYERTGVTPSLDQMKGFLHAVIRDYSRVFIVIDALDEISDESARSKFLECLQELGPSVSILATSRPQQNIAQHFNGAKKIELSANNGDIEKYLRSRTGATSRLTRMIQVNPQLGDEIVRTVIQAAQKM